MRNLALALLVLVVIFLGARWFESRRQAPPPFSIDFTTVTDKVVDRVIVDGPEEIVLTKKDDDWMVRSHRATDVAEFITTMQDTKVGDVISRDKGKHGTFEVDEELGRRIKFYNGKEVLADIIIGKEDFPGSFFLRLPDKNEVYQATGKLNSYAAKTFQDWVDKTILNVDTSKVSGVSLKYPDGSVVLKRHENAWVSGSESVPAERVDALLEQLAQLSGRQVALERPDLSAPDAEVEIEVEGGNKQEVLFKRKDGTDFWVKRADGDPVYLLDSSVAESILVTSEELEQE